MIFNVPSLSAVALLTLASAGSVAAVPSPLDYPEVIPGPGMPSLESLGLTSKDLYKGTEPLGKRGLLGRSFCIVEHCQAPVGEAQACINYLRNLGTRACGFTLAGVVMCMVGQATVSGRTAYGLPQASSYCSDVAAGGQYVINSCTYSGSVGGQDVANGNGNLIVSIC